MLPRVFLALLAVIACAPGCIPAIHTRPRVDPVLYPEPSANAITFWGHACAYIDIDGFGIVTDPVFTGRWAIVRHRLIPIPPPEAYDQTRLILISHAHQDHLDPKTLARFSPRTVILAPGPAAKYLSRRGIRAHVMVPGGEYQIPGGLVTAVAACHPGGRYAMKARADGRALGYVIHTAKTTIYYSGDTKYFPGFAAIGREYRPDIVLLNVNRHLHSSDALLAIEDLGAPIVIPSHYGAYSGPSARLGARWRAELVQAMGSTIVPLEVGQRMRIPGTAAAAQPRTADARALETLTTSTGKHFAVPVPDGVGIPNFAEIQSGLTRGGRPTKEGIQFLRDKGYRTVVSFRSNRDERYEVLRSGMEYVEIPMHAGLFGAAPPTGEQVRLFLSVVSDSSRYPIFMHCRRGKDRTGVMSAIYRMEACGWTADEAIEEMKAFGFSGHYRGLLRFVRAYSRDAHALAH